MNELHVCHSKADTHGRLLHLYRTTLRGCECFPKHLSQLKRHVQLYAIRNSLPRREAHLNDTDQ